MNTPWSLRSYPRSPGRLKPLPPATGPSPYLAGAFRSRQKAGCRPWSAKELNDLVRGLQIGVSVAVIADFMARHEDEVRQKAVELGLLPKRKMVEEAFN